MIETTKEAVTIRRGIGRARQGSVVDDPDYAVEDVRLLEKDVMNVCPAEVTFTVFSPSPGTELWHKHKEDYICDPYLYYDCMHTILPTRLELKKFYRHFARLTSIALRANPLRVNKVRVPLREIVKAIFRGTKYIFALRSISRDYSSKT